MPIDLRLRKLANLAVNYSVALKPGETVILSGDSNAIPFLTELYKSAILAKAHPIVRVHLPGINDFFYKHASYEQLEKFPQYWMDTVKTADSYIGVVSGNNTRELSNIDPKKISIRNKVLHPISDYIVNTHDKIRRCTISNPCSEFIAQEAELSMDEYEKFVFDACLIDWKKFGKRLDQINKVFEKGKNVHLLGENVDLKFSITGKNCVPDKGEENMPGGEVFMAPVRESVNGFIKFEYPAIYHGKEVTDIFLKFKDGKVIESKASKNEDLLKTLLAMDENASYVGEFGVGCNYGIKKFSKELLFDEKIGGTIHLALGMAYKQNGGGNDSSLHWDIVKDMKKAKIILDGKVIQENAKWKI